MSGPFKMKGSGHYGHGNQKRKDGMPFTEAIKPIMDMVGGMSKKESPADYASPAKTHEEGHKGLTPEQEKQKRYVELSEKYENEPGFKEARDVAFGGKTTVKDSVSTTEKPA